MSTPNKHAVIRYRRGICVFCGVALSAVSLSAHSVRNDLKQMATETGTTVAMFDHGRFSVAPMDRKKDWHDRDIPGAIGHSFSYEGMLSPDGTLAAFPYWWTNPCPSINACDITADQGYFLAIVNTDGSGEVRTYRDVVLPTQMCWTRDNSKLAMIAHSQSDKQPKLTVLDLSSGRADRLADGAKLAVTPQCWSPDTQQIVYFAGDRDWDRPGVIRLFDVNTHQSRVLLEDKSECGNRDKDFCVSPYPTWSPDGAWIAFFQDKAYWAVHPSGEGRKKLFDHGKALSPLQWSPDGRYALYADCCAFWDTLHCMCEIGRVHVRRLIDGADLEISGDGYQDMFIPRWTWIQTKDRTEPETPPTPQNTDQGLEYRLPSEAAAAIVITDHRVRVQP